MMVLRYLIKSMLLPPALNMGLMAIGFLILQGAPRLAKALISVSFFSLFFLSMPIVADILCETWESCPSLDFNAIDFRKVAAIVVLSGGRYAHPPEFDHDVGDGFTLERLRYAAYLHRKTHLPILVTGGAVFKGQNASLAEIMAASLRNNWGIQVAWQEKESRTTRENALKTAKVLMPGRNSTKKRILLVTHAIHMPRAVLAFQQVGFDVIPAPTRFHDEPDRYPLILRLIPSAGALDMASRIFHEYLGLFWYTLAYGR